MPAPQDPRSGRPTSEVSEERSGMGCFANREQLIGHGQRRWILGPGQPGHRETAPGGAAQQHGTQPLDPDVEVGAPGRGFGSASGDREAGRILRQQWIIDSDGDCAVPDVSSAP